MSITIQEAKAFIVDCVKGREPWYQQATRSWNEIKKRQPNGKLWPVSPNSVKQRAKYPAWYSIFKIRQPLLLSRIGIPVGKDTTQDGIDNVGATAAICLERLAINLPKNFDFFGVLSMCRDDFLATNFGMARAYYEREVVTEKVKEYITFQPTPDGQGGMFIDSKGNEVLDDNIMEDDEGYFLEKSQTVDVEDERICLDHILYRDVYIDPDIRRFGRCKRLAFAEYYSEPEFKEIFGAKALLTIPKDSSQTQDESAPKRKSIKVFEYWDEYEEEVKWFADNGTDFITPRGYLVPEEGEEYVRGLYNLEKFFPVVDPLIINSSTDEFWPVPEYYQVTEILDDIHTIFSRMMALTRAIRARLLFDNSIEGLQAALNEASEGDAFGVTNLAASLAGAGGSLDQVVQYIPVDKLINGLNQLYTALEQRLNVLFKLTGTSDLLQGLTTQNTDKTLGERQMEEKYAINQIAEPQRKMAEFVRGSYQLMCEMALKNFKDESLDKYIMPQTLDPEHQHRYKAALGMLKENSKRFRIELETDSTIAINEDYDKKMRVELVNTISNALEKVSAIAESDPSLVALDLHALKYLIQGMRQGKMFQSEFTQAIDQKIEEVKGKQAPFDKDMAVTQIEAQKVQIERDKLALDTYVAQQAVAKDSRELEMRAKKEQLEAELKVLTFELEKEKAGVEIQNKLSDNQRLEQEVYLESQRIATGMEGQKGPQVVIVPPAPQPQAPPIIVAPQAAPQGGPTIINAPNPSPQTSVIQPVQEVPVPIVPTNPLTGGGL